MNEFEFSMGEKVKLESGETGTVIARAQYLNSTNQYLIRYKAGDGRLTEVWWAEDAISKSS